MFDDARVIFLFLYWFFLVLYYSYIIAIVTRDIKKVMTSHKNENSENTEKVVFFFFKSRQHQRNFACGRYFFGE